MNIGYTEIFKQKASSTAKNVVFGSLLLATANTFQPQVIGKISGNSTTTALGTSVVGSQYPHTDDLVVADDEEVIALFLKIEPEYRITNQMLADL